MVVLQQQVEELLSEGTGEQLQREVEGVHQEVLECSEEA